MERITFKKNGYDPLIDFVKGYCIILIVFDHCFPGETYTLFPLWGTPAVPILLMIQVFHQYKNGIEGAKFNWCKVWKRVIRPFLVVQIILFTLLWYFTGTTEYAISIIEKKGCIGAGEYYPWFFLQFAILLPLLSKPLEWICHNFFWGG